MNDYQELLALFENRRRVFIDQLDFDDDPKTAARLADVQLVIMAIRETVDADSDIPRGRDVTYDGNGWPE
ncbi:hypothetical protein HJB77_27300 [Rhizobium lentis]|uniref:hypothetical protein n=1 Tax=Rhizobium lentis TaxID=1138194 RepID=UPI001C833081|nr:hypothetical protein [Rhizobium lentis]MBX5179930.1 hypothetical protein [Rhizobium lentis]